MHRILAPLVLIAVVALSACSGDEPAVPATTATPSTAPPSTVPPSSASPSASPAAEAPDGLPAQTDPTKLDGALLQREQLPGWERVETERPPLASSIEPAACQALHDQTLGKVASDMGATVAYQRGEQFLQEYLDLVDRGTDSVTAVEQAVASCPRFVTTDAGEQTTVTVTPLAVPQLGDRGFGVKLTIEADTPAELLYAWGAHRDVAMMVHLDGPTADEPTLVQTAQAAADRLRSHI
jgi:hypothetical protein